MFDDVLVHNLNLWWKDGSEGEELVTTADEILDSVI